MSSEVMIMTSDLNMDLRVVSLNQSYIEKLINGLISSG